MATSRGHTLLELLVTLGLLAALVAIALPSYAEYVARSRRLEARTVLLEAAHWMERWRTEQRRYDDPANAGVPPPGFPWRQVPSGGRAHYTISLEVTATRYRITATAANVMAGDTCATLSIDETGLRGYTGTGATDDVCWNR